MGTLEVRAGRDLLVAVGSAGRGLGLLGDLLGKAEPPPGTCGHERRGDACSARTNNGLVASVVGHRALPRVTDHGS